MSVANGQRSRFTELSVIICTIETRRELREVTEELDLIEQQLQALLERQGELSDKKQRLQNTLRDLERLPSANQSKDWENTGKRITLLR